MTIVQLEPRRVAKVWGRHDLPAMFGPSADGEGPIGEIRFERPDLAEAALLVKYLFTSDRLSIQVHPDDALARKAGHANGKEEVWLVLDAEPGAVIGIGLTAPLGRDALRAAALDGSIEALLDWRPAARGDIYHLKPGTVHALGAGLTILEVQQYADLTYRLYDYGRPRALHVDEGIAVANPGPGPPPPPPRRQGDGRDILVEGGAFVLERWTGPVSASLRARADRPLWLVAIEGAGRLDGRRLEPGSVWLADAAVPLDLDRGARLLAAYPGGTMAADLVG